MNAEAPAQTPDMIGVAAEERRPATPRALDRAFSKALVVAVLLHASFFITLIGAKPQRLGEEGGADDAINVSLVTEADLKSATTVPAEAPAEVAPPPQQAKPQQEPQEAQPEQPPAPDLKQTLPAEDPKPAEPEPPEDAKAPTEEDVPDLFALPDPAAEGKKSEQAKPKKAEAPPKPAAKPAKKPSQKTAALDLSTPAPSFNAPPGAGGRAAGFSRPPGITRSGENDDFARKVIRALQATMPQLTETRGRVTVKILLNDNGNVVDVTVVRPSPIASLDQSVLFAAKQTSYPFPPVNANLADRTFIVTYIYE